MPDNSMPKDAAYQVISDELMLDGNPRLNLASFVTTWMEPECDKLIMESVNKNYVDMDEYPVTTELQVPPFVSPHLLFQCSNMFSILYNTSLFSVFFPSSEPVCKYDSQLVPRSRWRRRGCYWMWNRWFI